MESRIVSIDVIMDADIFRKFAIFDNLYRQRRWVLPIAFALILSVFAVICFAASGATTQAVMLGCVLLIIGAGLPAAHIWTFFRSIKAQIKAYGLETPKPVYSLRLSDAVNGVSVTNPGGEAASYEWDKLYGAYRVAGCTYLYIVSNKAFLLPDVQVDGGADSLWALLSDMLPAEKLHDRRKA